MYSWTSYSPRLPRLNFLDTALFPDTAPGGRESKRKEGVPFLSSSPPLGLVLGAPPSSARREHTHRRIRAAAVLASSEPPAHDVTPYIPSPYLGEKIEDLRREPSSPV